MNRREFLTGAVATGALPLLAGKSELCHSAVKPEFHAFSRVFQFLKDPYKAASFLKSCCYDGVEWTVRSGGFLDPGKVYLGTQIEFAEIGVCYGVVADTSFILVCSYSVDGSLLPGEGWEKPGYNPPEKRNNTVIRIDGGLAIG